MLRYGQDYETPTRHYGAARKAPLVRAYTKMMDDMEKGMSFTAAHKTAKESVGH